MTGRRATHRKPPPPVMADFSSPEYWEAGYRDGTAQREWYVSAEECEPLLLPLLPAGKESRILVLGCGESETGPRLYAAGHHACVSVDISASVIKKMRDQYATACPGMRWEVMDVTDLSLPDASFDLVIDKATSDAFLAVNHRDAAAVCRAHEQVRAMHRHVHRVLAPGGRLFVLTKHPPSRRLPLFRGLEWCVKHSTIPARRLLAGLCHVFVLTKQSGGADDEAASWHVEPGTFETDDTSDDDDSDYVPDEEEEDSSSSSGSGHQDGDTGSSEDDEDESEDDAPHPPEGEGGEAPPPAPDGDNDGGESAAKRART